MVKKALLSIVAASSLLAVNCDAPNNNIEDLLSCAKSELLLKNPNAKVYLQTISVPKNQQDPQYYDFLFAKYNEAFLKIKAQLALKVAGELITSEIASKDDKSKMPPELVEEFLNKEIERQKRISENKIENGFFDKLMGKIFSDSEEAPAYQLKPEQEKELKIQAKQTLYSNSFKEKMNKVAREEIAGLIPYENFIVVNDNGETEIGIVAYTSAKSRELARALASGYKAKAAKNENACKSADEVVSKIGGSDEKINKLGLTFFYNEECQPSLLAYGMDSYKVEEGMTNEYKNTSYSMAQALAEKALANFVSSSIYTYTNAEKVTENIQTAYKEIVEDNSGKRATGGKQTTANSYSHLEEFFSSNAQMSLVGVEVANKWTKQFDDFGVAGVILYYSPSSVAGAKQERLEIKGNLDNKSKQEAKTKGAKPANANIIRSKNIEVDDF